MPIRFKCNCGKKLKVGDDFAGRDVKCPGCGRSAHVPTAEEASALHVQDVQDYEAMPTAQVPSRTGRGGNPVDMAEAKRESRRAGRDRRKEADIRPGKVRLGTAARKEARAGLREQGKRTKESRRGAKRAANGRPSAGALREASAEIRNSDRRREESARMMRPVSMRDGPVGLPAGGGAVPPGVTPPFCPTCRAVPMDGAKMCTVCGVNFSTGERYGMKTPFLERFSIKAAAGPVLAVVLMAVGWIYVKPLLLKPKEVAPSPTKVEPGAARPPKGKPQEGGGGGGGGGGGTPAETPPTGKPPTRKPPTRTPRERAETPDIQDILNSSATPPVDKYTAAAYKGGIITEAVTLSDKSAPYTLDRAIRIEGGTLKIGPGVRIEGKEITLAQGSLHLTGTKDEPIRLNVKINNRRGPAEEFIAQNCHFLDHFAANASKKLLLDRCTFEKTVRIEPTGMRMVSGVSIRVTNSELRDTALSAVLRASYSADKLEMLIERCNIFGPVDFRTDMFSKITFKGCSFPNRKDLRGLRTEGDLVEQFQAPSRLRGVGAGNSAAAGTGTGPKTGGSVWAKESEATGTDGRSAAFNDKMGFTIEFPIAWRTGTNGQLILGPYSLARPKVEVKAASAAISPNKAIEALVAELKKKGAKAIKSSPTIKGFHPAGESWSRMLSYDAAGWRFRKKYVSVAAKKKMFIIIATFRDDKAIEAGPSIDAVIMSFKVH